MRRGALAALLALAGCARSAGPDSTVALEYELSSGGALIEASPKDEPLVVTLGTGGLPEAVEAGLVGLKPGAERILDLPAEKAFGAYDAAKVKAVPLGAFGEMAKGLKPGSTVAGTQNGRAAEGRVVKIEGGAATLDFNHPLAGKALRYRLKILAVR
ncbi:MAG: FKBP-type peptidyl-prolyl cis-trans isomerase [Elusimicrobiota bacterium]|nr:MAG: FKBP-type peptidyl-prolyl cis-trans isomerase [Elusimicrobiota bacterium]